MLLGSAILGAVAAGRFASMTEGMAAMSQAGGQYHPDADAAALHDARYRTFCALQSALRDSRA